MGKALIKILLLLLPIMSIIFILKMSARTVDTNTVTSHLNKPSTATDTTYYFIGSSRVQQSVNPQIINAYYKHINVFNLGIAGGTFLSNCIMADFIAQKNGCKVVFIELSPLLDQLPVSLFNFSSQTGFSPLNSALKLTSDQSFSARSMLALNIVNQYIFNSINVLEEVKKIIGYKKNENTQKWIGFKPSDQNDFHNTTSFVSWEEINDQSTYSIELNEYRQIIDYLQG